jgi:multicomponent K+:H+ antiporter subunit E
MRPRPAAPRGSNRRAQPEGSPVSRLLPAPWLSLGIFGGWLLLNDTLAVAHLLLAALLALVIPRLGAPLRPAPGRLRRLPVLVRLVLRVGWGVGVSAVEVMWGVLNARRRPPRSCFVVVPLALRDDHALAALAMIAAVVPGTVWAELATDRSALLMHVFDLDDEAAFIADFRASYEQPLLEIFE